MSNVSISHCPRCGSLLEGGSVDGLCAACLGALNFATETGAPGQSPAASRPSLTPEELAPHFPQLEILACLGRGGMGVVYKARQKSLNRLVALKLLAPERADDPQFAARFEKEAHALAALNHSHIVAVYDFGQAGGFYYLLMEFVNGVNLRQLMQAKKLTPREALNIVPPICEALQCAHDHGIVHRDIKPENLLIDKAGKVKIADFGIAKMVGAPRLPEDPEAEGDSPKEGTIGLGTPDYAAPEQHDCVASTDHRADIYSLGVVLYEMLTGERPADNFVPPSKCVQMDVRIDEIVLRALEKTPELRFATATEFRTQVEAIAGGSPARAAAPLSVEHSLLPVDGVTKFRSLTALNISYLALLGLLGFLGFIPGLEKLFGLFGLLGLISVAYVIEGFARAKMGTFSPVRLARMTTLGNWFLSLACLLVVGAGIASYELSTQRRFEPEFEASSIIGIGGDAATRERAVRAMNQIERDDLSVRVKHTSDAEILTITAIAKDPIAAANIANSLAEASLERLRTGLANNPSLNFAVLQKAEASPAIIKSKPALPVMTLGLCGATFLALPGMLMLITARIGRKQQGTHPPPATPAHPQGPSATEASDPQRPKWVSVVAAALLMAALFGGLFIASGIYSLVMNHRARQWPGVDGQVVSSEIKRVDANTSSRTKKDVSQVKYTYIVGDRTYKSDTLYFGSIGSSLHYYLPGEALKYPLGKQVRVLYDPANPASSVLDISHDYFIVAKVGVGLLLLGVYAAFISRLPR